MYHDENGKSGGEHSDCHFNKLPSVESDVYHMLGGERWTVIRMKSQLSRSRWGEKSGHAAFFALFALWQSVVSAVAVSDCVDDASDDARLLSDDSTRSSAVRSCCSRRFSTLSCGSLITLSRPDAVIFVQPYKSAQRTR